MTTTLKQEALQLLPRDRGTNYLAPFTRYYHI